jgi:hypothetical protein
MFSIEFHLKQQALKTAKTPNLSPARSPVAKFDPQRTFGANVSQRRAHYVPRQGTDILNQKRLPKQPRPF